MRKLLNQLSLILSIKKLETEAIQDSVSLGGLKQKVKKIKSIGTNLSEARKRVSARSFLEIHSHLASQRDLVIFERTPVVSPKQC